MVFSRSRLALLLFALTSATALAQPISPAPLDCLPGGGTLYDIGPGQPLADISAVPWETLTAGDTVRIHWRPEPYREKILLHGQGSAQQPITVCGVAGPNGELPVIDGENATTRPSMGYSGQGTQTRGLIHIAPGSDDPWGYKPQHILVQGLHLTGAFHENSFTNSSGASADYTPNAAGIFVERGEHITIRGVIISGNGNGFFVASSDSEEMRSRDITLEHSAIYGNGTVTTGFDRHHNIYTEAEGMLFQFNYIGPLRDGSGGSTLKDRSAGTVIRYNWIEGGARTLDLVDAEDSWSLATPLPAYRSTFVYGNVLVNGPNGPTNMVHYGGDSGVEERYRKGILHFFHNTVVITSDQDQRWRVILLDVSTEDETVDARNNIVFIQSSTPGARASDLAWMRSAGVLELGVNWATPGITEFRDGVETTGSVSGMQNLLGNAENDPGFVSHGDLHLRPGAATIDVGQALHPAVLAAGHAADFEYVHPARGEPRAQFGEPDLGAFEAAGRSEAFAWPTAPLLAQSVGFAWPAGPDGVDNGQRHACTGTGASPAVLCVHSAAREGGNGSAAAPFDSINAAIAAAEPGDIIQVAAGTYGENVQIGEYNDMSPKHLTLLGGFDPFDFGVRDAGRHHTTIDGGFLNPALRAHIWSDGTTVIDGFRMTRGRGLGRDWEDGYGAGGGIYVNYMGHGEVVVSHNVVYDNESAEYDSYDVETRGGGIHVDFQDWDGDSLGDVRIENNIVRDNRANRGAGINVRGPRAIIVGNIVEDNIGHGDHGGGIYISTDHTTVERNVVRGNVTGATYGYGWGGGILIAAASADLVGNVITDNYAPTIGSGIFWDEGATGTMRFDLIYANRCPADARSGAAIYVDGGEGPSRVVVTNATVADHDCPDSEGGAIYLQAGSTITIRDSIIWGNTHEFTDDDGGSHTITNSITAAAGEGNFLVDPLFAYPSAGDYRAQAEAARGLGAFRDFQ